MEIWELLKSLFSEVNFLLKCLTCSSVKSHWWRQVQKRSLRAEGSSAWTVLWKQQCWSHRQSEERIPKHRMRQSLSQSYSSEKPYSWQVHFVWMCDAFKRLTNTVACCYETYRMRREGKVESPSHVCLLFRHLDKQTQRMQRSWHRILQPCWCNSLGMPLLSLEKSYTTRNWGYFVRRGTGWAPHPL